MKKLLGIVVLGLLLVSCVSDRPTEFLKLPKNERLKIVENLDARVNIFDGEKDIVYVGTWGSRLFKEKGFGNKNYVVASRYCKDKFDMDIASEIGIKTMSKQETEKYKLWNKVYIKYQCSKSTQKNIVESEKSNNTLNRSFVCSYQNDKNEKSKIQIRGSTATEVTAIGISINYSIVNLSSKGAFNLKGSSKGERAWFIGAKSFLLLGVDAIPYNCN
tara:strand:+ start:50 stop:700 length:651 start_codon:yes stop_codon:yes gene_type:complete